MKPLVLACLIDPFVQILRNRKMGAAGAGGETYPNPCNFVVHP